MELLIDLAPRAGLEPATNWLTVNCSTNWATEECKIRTYFFFCLTQTKVAKAINVTFQQIQKYEKGTNGVSSIRLLQLSNYLKVPINYFFEDFSEYLINIEKSKEGHMNVNYNFLTKLYSELNADQKLKFNKSLQISGGVISKAV